MRTARLSEVADFIRGITFKPEDLTSLEDDDAVVCMRTKNIQDELDQSDLIAVPSRFVRREELFLRPGDLLISSANSWDLVGKTVFVEALPFRATAGGFIAILRARTDVIDSRYLFQWLRTPRTQLIVRHCGRQTTNISNLSIDRFLELRIPVPKMEKQREIAATLDKSESIQKKRQTAMRLILELLRAVFIDLFGDPAINPKKWPIRSLGELAAPTLHSIKAGPFGSSLRKEMYSCAGYKIYGQEQVIRDDLAYGDYYIDANKYRELSACRIASGDLLISLVGSFGKISVVPDVFEPGIINPRLMKISLDPGLALPHFVKALLTSDSMREKIESHSHGGTMGIVNVGIMKALKVPVPPIRLQLKYEVIAARLRTMIEKQQHLQDETDRLLASLQELAFAEVLP